MTLLHDLSKIHGEANALTNEQNRDKRVGLVQDADWDTLEVQKLVNGAGLGDEASVVQPSECAHGEAAVLNFINLVPCQGLRILAEAERVETKVARLAVAVQSLAQGNGAENLEEGAEQKDLGHAAGFDEEVVGFGRVHGLDTRELEDLLDDNTENAKHSDAACSKRKRGKVGGNMLDIADGGGCT